MSFGFGKRSTDNLKRLNVPPNLALPYRADEGLTDAENIGQLLLRTLRLYDEAHTCSRQLSIAMSFPEPQPPVSERVCAVCFAGVPSQVTKGVVASVAVIVTRLFSYLRIAFKRDQDQPVNVKPFLLPLSTQGNDEIALVMLLGCDSAAVRPPQPTATVSDKPSKRSYLSGVAYFVKTFVAGDGFPFFIHNKSYHVNPLYASEARHV